MKEYNMHALFCNFDEDWHVDVIKGVAKGINADKVVSISVLNHALQNDFLEYLWIDSSDISQHKYSEIGQFDLASIDGNLIERMLECEELYLEMLDRSELVACSPIRFQDRKYYYYNDIRIMLGILEQHTIDVCIFTTIPHIGYDYVLYSLCKLYNIKVCINYFGLPIPFKSATMFFLSDIFEPLPQFANKGWEEMEDTDILPKRVQAYIDCYSRKREEIVSFVYYSDFVKAQENIVSRIIKLAYKKMLEGSFGRALKRKWISNIRLKRISRVIQKYVSEPADEQYLYYPLHYQPECTSLPMGGYFYDQLLVVKLLSDILPPNVFLYVKPHPHRSLLADEKFYEEIHKLNNVKLLSDKVNTYSLIDNALAVVSLTGTVICEALVREKPVLMFGYYIWQYAPGVFHCKSKEDCKVAIEQICSGKRFSNIKKFRAFLLALDKYLYDGVMNQVALQIYDISKEKNIENIINGFVDYILGL